MRGLRQGWCAALLWALLGVAGCAAVPQGGVPRGDLRTVSDQSDAERRARVRMELAAAYLSQGQLETALDELKQSLAIYANLAEAWNLRGLIYAGLGQAQWAQESFERALSLDAADGNIWHNLGWFECQQGRYEAADRAFNRALAQPTYRDPSKTGLAKGVCESLAGKSAAALRTLTAAYERDPGNPALAVNLSDLLRRQGDFERAAFFIRRVNQQPAYINAQSLWLAARIERRLGRDEAVRDLVQQIRTRFPNSPEALAAERGTFDD